MIKTKIATASASGCVRALSCVKPCAQCRDADTASNCNSPNNRFITFHQARVLLIPLMKSH